MAVFLVEAMDSRGQKMRKEIEAANRDDALTKIKGMGFFPTKIKQMTGEEGGGGGGGGAAAPAAKARKSFVFGRVKLTELSQFTSQLSTLQDAGLPIVRSIRILEGQLRPCPLKNTLQDVADEVESGSTLSEAMAKHPKAFDRLYVNMIKAGEAGGVLDTILDRLAHFMEKSLKLRKKVIGALIYPAVVTVIAVAIVSGIMIFVIPAFKKMFEDAELALPAPTQMLITLSDVLSSFWFLLPGIPAVLYAAYVVAYRSPAGKMAIDRVKLNLPIFGTIIKKSTIARFTRTLGTLVASGVPILEALSIVREAIDNSVVQDAVDRVHGSIKEGESIARPLGQSGVFDDMIVNMVDVGEETGELDKMLLKIADNYEDDVDIAVEGLTSVIEPILIVGMGGAVGFIVVALFMPLIELIKGLSG